MLAWGCQWARAQAWAQTQTRRRVLVVVMLHSRLVRVVLLTACSTCRFRDKGVWVRLPHASAQNSHRGSITSRHRSFSFAHWLPVHYPIRDRHLPSHLRYPSISAQSECSVVYMIQRDPHDGDKLQCGWAFELRGVTREGWNSEREIFVARIQRGSVRMGITYVRYSPVFVHLPTDLLYIIQERGCHGFKLALPLPLQWRALKIGNSHIGKIKMIITLSQMQIGIF
jgi:hypothetical protein